MWQSPLDDGDMMKTLEAAPADELGVIVITLDNTNRVMAAFGPETTQRVRVAAIDAVRALVSPRANTYRMMYDNCLVIFDTNGDSADEMARDIEQRLSKTIAVDGVDYFIEATIAVATTRSVPEARTGWNLVQAAVAIVHYESKGMRMARHGTMADVRQLRSEVVLAAELAHGVGSEFELYYQPIVDLETLETVGVESLLRWEVNDAVREPKAFLQAAEETSLIVPLGRWGLHQALAQLSRWNSEHPELFVAVNFSTQQLYDDNLAREIETALTTHSIDPRLIWIEVTERNLVADDTVAAHTLTELDALGCVVCVDDLGTGYGALGYLAEHPVKVVKVDRSMIARVETDLATRSIVRALCALSTSLGISTVAEGVENKRQLPLLRDLGFDRAQGYLFGRPLPAGQMRL